MAARITRTLCRSNYIGERIYEMNKETPQWIRDSFRGVFGPMPDDSIDDNAPWPRDTEWILVLHKISCTETWLQFEGAAPTARELLAVRKCVDRLRHSRPAEIRDKTQDDGRYYLGSLFAYEFAKLERLCETHRVRLYCEDASTTRYKIYNKTRDVLWRIKDETRYNQVVAEMMEYGIPVYDGTNAT